MRGIISGFEVMPILNVWWVNDYVNFPKQLQNSVFKSAIFCTARNAWYLQTFPPRVLLIFVTFTFQSFYMLILLICSVFTNLQFRFQNVKFWFHHPSVTVKHKIYLGNQVLSFPAHPFVVSTEIVWCDPFL